MKYSRLKKNRHKKARKLQNDVIVSELSIAAVNVVSFGLVATAIPISMFLVMGIFESMIRTSTKLTNSYYFSRSGWGSMALHFLGLFVNFPW
ncbi:hypothetical protein HID58_013535 [Brassica napus]|uniref:Uncharacterized protein n=1 Tax=Brassica napus TaxID=3708 RepID=A0ABQ8E461_BRANA|nr:hypothetical protein HID58_013535 [Brassica napus]